MAMVEERYTSVSILYMGLDKRSHTVRRDVTPQGPQGTHIKPWERRSYARDLHAQGPISETFANAIADNIARRLARS